MAASFYLIFVMLITSTDFAMVAYAPKAVWAKLTRGPEPEENPVARSIDRGFYVQTKERFGAWVGRELGAVRDLRPLFDLSWPEANECYESAAREALESGERVIGSHFRSGDYVAAPDILAPLGAGRLSMLQLDPTTQPDPDRCALKALFNKVVLEKNGFAVCGIRLFQLNANYVEGKSAPRELFEEVDIGIALAKFEPGVGRRFEELEVLKHQFEPPQRVGVYCPRVDDPALPKEHVFLLKNGGKRAAMALAAGITELKNIPLDETIRDTHRIQIECSRSGERHIDKERLGEFIGRLRYPLQSLDFETVSTPLPLFNNSRPHQNVPCQFSLHVREAPGESLLRSHFIHRAPTDPRPALLKALESNVRPEGSILVYSKACEENVLKELGRDFAEFKGFCEQVVPRLVDLYEVFRGFMIYDPRQLGKTRFKKVLDCFAGKSYEGLEIQNGETATYEYQRVTYEPLGPVTDKERDAVYKRLLTYCDQDSWGQHELADVIEQLSGARIAHSAGVSLGHRRAPASNVLARSRKSRVSNLG